ncbi:MAG TPA: tetratricopeptide repeat protein [Longimicrobium sp.]
MRLTTSRPIRKPGPNRRQRVPPALTRGTERLEAISILDEIPGDLGLVLWRSARNVLLWAEAPAESRAALFAGDAARVRRDELANADVDPELRGPVSVFADLLRHPGQTDLLRLVNACRRVATWAEARGSLHTALEFAQAAALAAPDSASLAYGVGRVARRLADYDRAESWYTRAVVQGRDAHDWRSYASGLAGMGNLHMQRGNYPAAKRVHQRCLHAADRHRLADLRGAAYHNLFSIAIEMRAGPEADVLAAHALAAYTPGDPGVLRLAIDVAYHWNLTGNFGGALQVALALEPLVDDPPLRPSVQSLIARAAGGVGDRARYEAAVARMDELLSDPAIPEEMVARALLGLAHGALNLGDRRAAALYADEAISIARRRCEGRVVLEAEAVLDASTRPVMSSAPETGVASPAPALADQLVQVLSRDVVAVAC